MSEKNGDASGIGYAAKTLVETMKERRAALLVDLSPGYPAIRRFLLGYEIGGRVYPAGSIRIETDTADCVILLSIPMLGVQAQYRGTSAAELLECIENDLDTETVPWDHSWEVKKKQREKARRDIGLA